MKEIEKARNDINSIDEQMAKLFEKRMQCAKLIAEYKKANSLPIFDEAREKEVININKQYIGDNSLQPFYEDYLRSLMDISKSYQQELITPLSNKVLNVRYQDTNYPVFIEKDSLDNLKSFIDVTGKILVLTDDNVVSLYLERVMNQLENGYSFVIPHGEANKSFSSYEKIMHFLSINNFTRSDAIIALGGGVIGDLAGFAASTYMRGIKFYNIPTTLLSQLDSSIGGKTAIDFENIKNIIGSFYPPNAVIIDSSTLKTLDKRNFNAGLAEAIKMALTSNRKLYYQIKNSNNIYEEIDNIIYQALQIKQNIVEKDPKEKSLRKILNFGHTFGHAIEACAGGKYLHGECVAMGMMYMVDENIKLDLRETLLKYELPIKEAYSFNSISNYLIHDKKAAHDEITVVIVNKIGECELKKCSISMLEKIYNGEII